MSVQGSYKITVSTPVGLQEGLLTLVTNGGKLSGAIENSRGISEFSDGWVEGDEVRFTAKIHTPVGRVKAEITGRIDGDAFTGAAKLPLGAARIEGVRV